MRRPIVVGNWKMHKTVAEARVLATGIVSAAGRVGAADMVLGPPFTALAAVADVVDGSEVEVAAQDMFWADEGAYTGAVSPVMVRELASYVIIGHSERRRLFGDTDEEVSRKVHAALAHGLVPILCLGETEDQRAAGQGEAVVAAQLAAATEGVADTEMKTVVIAYEPVWAIGTGRACAGVEAARVAALIRRLVADAHGAEAGTAARILYGGSVKRENVGQYVASASIDGALVGGASLDAEEFVAVVAAYATR